MTKTTLTTRQLCHWGQKFLTARLPHYSGPMGTYPVQCFSQLKKVWKDRKICLRIKVRMLEATVMTVGKYDSEAWSLRKTKEDLLGVFQRNYIRIVLVTRLTDSISNSRLYEMSDLILISRAIMRKRFRWLGQVLRLKDERLPKIVLFGQQSKAKWKAGRQPLWWEDFVKRNLRETGTSWEDVKSKALNRLG